MKKKTILIVTEELINLKKMYGNNLILATKSPYFFKTLENDVTNMVSLEEEEMMPSKSTWMLLDQINDIINPIVGDSRAWLYESGYHIEGSGLPQRLSEVLSATRILANILDKEVIDEIILYPCIENMLECMLIRSFAKELNIGLKIKWRNVKNYFLCNNYGIVTRIKYSIYYIQNQLRVKKNCKLVNNVKCRKEQQYQIGIIHASNTKKSINWKSTFIYGMDKEFETCKMLCLNCKDAAVHFRENGIDVDEMEEWLTKETLITNNNEYKENFKKIKNSINKLLQVECNGYNITEVVKYFIFQYLVIDVPRNIYIDTVCKDYFKKNKYQVLSSQGDSNFIETRAMYYNSRDFKTRIFRREGLMIFNVPRYEKLNNIIDIRFFCRGAKRYDDLLKEGWKGAAFWAGDTLYIPKFINMIHKRDNKIKELKDISVLWVPSYVVRGYTTYNSFQNNNYQVARWFEENEKTLYIKFHPSQNENQIELLREKYSNSKNVKIVDKKDSIVDWIDKSDIIITDKSMCIFDGITYGKPVMVLCSPLHYDLMKIHSEGVNIYQSFEELFLVLKKVTSNREEYIKWRDKTVLKQDNYFMNYVSQDDAIKDIADKIKKECQIR